jgi:hypothetical protein
MNLSARVKHLEKTIKPEEMPMAMFKYKILGMPMDKTELSQTERIDRAAKEMAEEFNLSLDKAKYYIDKIEPFFIYGYDKSKII